MPTLPRPPYSSDTHSQPAINVNLNPCTCRQRDSAQRADDHPYPCPGAPVLIPCPIPRSASFDVVLGECTRPGLCTRPTPMFQPSTVHISTCPARPVNVSCFLDGETWEGSEVGEIDVHESQNPAAHDTERILAACRERWALVKALVLGFTRVTLGGISRPQADKLFAQRDAVFAALADMARAEEAARNAQARAVAAFPWSNMKRDWDGDHIGNRRPSEDMLERYVEHLIEQVGVASW